MFLKGVGEPQRTQTRIKICTQYHQVSQYYMHALFLFSVGLNIKAINTLYTADKDLGYNIIFYNIVRTNRGRGVHGTVPGRGRGRERGH